MIEVRIPPHLQNLARIHGPVAIDLAGAITQRTLLDELERLYPALQGTIREHETKKRRAYVRFFACERDLSHAPPDDPLPPAVARGDAPFIVLGAMAGG